MIPTDPKEYLRKHIGLKYSIAEFERHKIKWTKTKLTEEDIKDPKINEILDICIRSAEYLKRVVANTRELAEESQLIFY